MFLSTLVILGTSTSGSHLSIENLASLNHLGFVVEVRAGGGLDPETYTRGIAPPQHRRVANGKLASEYLRPFAIPSLQFPI